MIPRSKPILRSRRPLPNAPFHILLAAAIAIIAPPKARPDRLESWQSCCGAVCLRTVAGLLGDPNDLATVRKILQPNSLGETSLAEIAQAAEKMGFYATGLTIKGEKLELCSVPLIVHKPPKHFVVLLGLGKNAGVQILDPPRTPRPMTPKQLNAQKHWNAVAVSTCPIHVDTGLFRLPLPLKTPATGENYEKRCGPLFFEQPLWYFGVARPGDKMDHSFSFVNTGPKTAAIADVKVNCACLEVRGFTASIAPGRRGSIEVRIDTSGIQGYTAKRVLPILADPPPAKKTDDPFFLTVTGEVSRRGEILFNPPELLLPDMVKGSTLRRTVTIKRIGFDQLRLADINSPSPAISAHLLPGSNQQAYQAQIEVLVHALGPIGPFEHKLAIRTDHTDRPYAELRVRGNIAPHIEARPHEAFLGLLSPGENPKKNVTLTSKTHTPFKVTAVSSSIAALVPLARPADKQQTIWKITFQSTPDLSPGILQGNLTVQTDDTDLPSLVIPLSTLVTKTPRP